MFASYSPAISPATKPPLPAFDISPPPLLEPTSPPFDSSPSPSLSPAPPVTSQVTSAPPAFSSTVALATNSAPPVKSPATPFQPGMSSPSPESLLIPASPATIPPPPPLVSLPPAVPLPSLVEPASQPPPFPFATFPVITRTFPPSAVVPAPPTAIFPPPSTPALPEVMPSPPPANIPPPPLSSPMLRPTSSSESLPVAVEVQKLSAFNMSSGLIVGLVIVAFIFVFVLAIVSVLCRNRKKKKQKNLCTHHHEESSPCVGSKESHVIQVLSNPTLPPHFAEDGGASGSVKAIQNHAPSINAFGSVNGIFTYEELAVATNGLSESNLLGQGGFGYVYKGVQRCGKEIAVKQLKTGSQQGEREFQAEVEIISQVHHKNLVELVGYCVTRTERLLVYEFVPNNTLEFHLHGEGKAVIQWATRIKIALGSAKGLAYLHEDCNPAIIHRDIKASNILLDSKFEPKVSDFGLAKIFPNTDGCISHITTRVVGTFGYMAPEYASSGKLTDKSDVYSYSVMLLELITGRPPITAEGSRNESLVDWARPLLAQALQDGNFNNLVDPRLQKNYDADEMARMITCAAACVRHSAKLRPRMSQIVGALEGLVSLTDLVGDITPQDTSLYSWSDSSDYDASQYKQDIRNFNLAISS